jgi:hypothetical protein
MTLLVKAHSTLVSYRLLRVVIIGSALSAPFKGLAEAPEKAGLVPHTPIVTSSSEAVG